MLLTIAGLSLFSSHGFTSSSEAAANISNEASVVGVGADEYQLESESSLFNDQRAWVCVAESVHSGQHYSGEYSQSRHHAEDSAIHECEDHEGHSCIIRGCEFR